MSFDLRMDACPRCGSFADAPCFDLRYKAQPHLTPVPKKRPHRERSEAEWSALMLKRIAAALEDLAAGEEREDLRRLMGDLFLPSPVAFRRATQK